MKTYMGSGLGTVIDITKAGLLSLIGSGDVVNATYKVTDIENGLFIQGIAPNNLASEGVLSVLAPAYVSDGDYKGQYHAELGAINDGEIYTWGEWNWENTSGSPITPTLPDENNINASGFTQLAKSTSNYYEVVNLKCVVDNQLNLNKITNPSNLNSVPYNFILVNGGSDLANPALAQLNLKSANGGFSLANDGCYGNDVALINNRIEDGGGGNNIGIRDNRGGLQFTNINRCYVNDLGVSENIGIASNDLFPQGTISNIVGAVRLQSTKVMAGGCKIDNIKSVSGGYIDILSCELHDNCQVQNWDFTGTGGSFQFWDNHLHENCIFENFDIQLTSGTYEFNNGHYNHASVFDNLTFTQAGRLQMNFGQNFNFDNWTNPNVDNSEFVFEKNNISTIDFTGFSSKTYNQEIVQNRGVFSFEHNFTTNPITSGNEVLYNLIPDASYATNATLIVNTAVGGTGSLEIGINTDDTDYVIAPTAAGSVANTVVNTLSNVTAANRSLRLAASGGDITSGVIRVKIEFVV